MEILINYIGLNIPISLHEGAVHCTVTVSLEIWNKWRSNVLERSSHESVKVPLS